MRTLLVSIMMIIPLMFAGSAAAEETSPLPPSAKCAKLIGKTFVWDEAVEAGCLRKNPAHVKPYDYRSNSEFCLKRGAAAEQLYGKDMRSHHARYKRAHKKGKKRESQSYTSDEAKQQSAS